MSEPNRFAVPAIASHGGGTGDGQSALPSKSTVRPTAANPLRSGDDDFAAVPVVTEPVGIGYPPFRYGYSGPKLVRWSPTSIVALPRKETKLEDERMTVHTRSEIERQLRLRLVPCTDNRGALVELGFTPAYPHLARDVYYGALWTRTIDAHKDPIAGRRSNAKALVVERAFHVGTERRARRIRLRRAGPCAAVTMRKRAYSPLRARRFGGVALHGDAADENASCSEVRG
jgi:hypothetical protein